LLDVRDAPVHGLLAITKENAVRSEGKLLEDDAQGFEVEILVINTQDGERTRTLKAALGERRLNLRLDECLCDLFLRPDLLHLLHFDSDFSGMATGVGLNVVFVNQLFYFFYLNPKGELGPLVALGVDDDVTAKAVADYLANAQAEAISVWV